MATKERAGHSPTETTKPGKLSYMVFGIIELVSGQHLQHTNLEHPPLTTYQNIDQVIEAHGQQIFDENNQTLLILDWDKTLRHQSLRYNFPLNLGRVSPQELQRIQELHNAPNTQLLIVTNQRDGNHWLAKGLGKIKDYEAFPWALQTRDIPYLADQAQPRFLIPYKTRRQAVNETLNWINQNANPTQLDTLIFAGDKYSDAQFANKLITQLHHTYPNTQTDLYSYLLKK